MKSKEFNKMSEPLREQRVIHLLMAKLDGGISLSSIMSGKDLFDFFQVLIDQNHAALEIMKDVIESREDYQESKEHHLLN